MGALNRRARKKNKEFERVMNREGGLLKNENEDSIIEVYVENDLVIAIQA